ncbi:pilus assembly protein PilP [Spongiibacter marinus]|uniref:pilus assembly protein PilP n=1 Tax=Spongiibacter marinus TaxID=354246 RepID=UPI0019606980|nr:pilus assembly protein PilP [Spongiibacter marinus]MBM7423563.1 type IV pilus assembly protein PilP [Spongiibacter marinus]
MRYLRLAIPLLSTMLLACSNSGQYADIDAFVAEKRAAPSGVIEPIPALQAYRAFTYTASGLRGPFTQPVDVKEIARLEASSNVKPNLEREREYLESFSIDALKMVGTVRLNKVLWALMKTPDGGVHRVKENNYLGRNHGKIMKVGDNFISVVEIVSTGGEGWVERPRSLELSSGK